MAYRQAEGALDPTDSGLIYIREQNGGEQAASHGGDDDRPKLETVIGAQSMIHYDREGRIEQQFEDYKDVTTKRNARSNNNSASKKKTGKVNQ